jgi:hypothetical protein
MEVVPTWSIDLPVQDKILAVLKQAEHGLTEDTITACVAMIDRALVDHGLVRLMLTGQVTATFTGSGDTERGNPDRYVFERSA